jgi:DNA-binding transcriptional MerR regulator
MKVSELAARAGTTAKTIRFYEVEGVLPSPARQDNGYRQYSEEDLCRVRLVVALRGLGLDLAESGRLAGLCASGRCDEMSADFAARIAERRASVATAMAELSHLDEELATLERALATGEPRPTFCLGVAAIPAIGGRA